MSYIPVRGLSWLAKRYYSEQIFPKITTHYSIVPRETDPRWKGRFMYFM
jgi:electron-transferring-flavoprotein dehydrogenase